MTFLNCVESSSDEVILLGAPEFGARTNKTPVLISYCSFKLREDTFVSKCDEALLQFIEILRKRDAAYIKYEWTNVKRIGLNATLDIYW